MNESQNVVTFRNRCNNYPYGVFVIDLINTLMVQEDLLVNAVNALDSAVYLRRLGEVLRTETLCYARLDSLYELLALLLIAFENILDLGICIGIEVAERKILKLLLYRPDSETMCNGSVDIHGFKRSITLFVERTVFQRADIVKPVRKLDDHYSDVLRHGKENFADILSLLLLLVKERYLAQLGNSVNEHCNVLTESLFQVVQSRRGVLDNIMQQSSADSIGVHAEFKQNIRNGKRVNDIRLTRGTLLSLMSLCRELIR